MSCISELIFPKCYLLFYFQKFFEKSNLFQLKEYLRMKNLGIRIN